MKVINLLLLFAGLARAIIEFIDPACGPGNIAFITGAFTDAIAVATGEFMNLVTLAPGNYSTHVYLIRRCKNPTIVVRPFR